MLFQNINDILSESLSMISLNHTLVSSVTEDTTGIHNDFLLTGDDIRYALEQIDNEQKHTDSK